jgi:hypothetical protein
MPRGMVRCGSLVSSAVVATTSNPMNAKNTRAAADRMPATPYVAGDQPSSHPNSDWRSAELPPTDGCAGGTNGR